MIALLVLAITGTAPNLLMAARLTHADGTTRPEVVTDGRLLPEGTAWNSEQAASLGREAVLEWDLGEVKNLGRALVQADNNDAYLVSGSEDGVQWSWLWLVPGVEGNGLRARSTTLKHARARYVRLAGRSGDRLYAVSEFALFATDELDVPSGLFSFGNFAPFARITSTVGVQRPEALFDERVPQEGASPASEYVATLAPGAVLELDLGVLTPLETVRLWADGDGEYVLQASEDGRTWTEVWRARPLPLPGQRLRIFRRTGPRARFVRLSIEGGDGRGAVGELQLFADPYAELSPEEAQDSGRLSANGQRGLIGLGLAGVLALAALIVAARRA